MLKKLVQKSMILLMVPFLMCISINTPLVKAAVDTSKIDAAQYKNVGITTATTLNVREKPNTSSKIVGKLSKGNAAIVKSKSGNWAKVTSGNVSGYVCTDYLAIGTKGYPYYDQYATKYVTVTASSLRVRKSNNTSSSILTNVTRGQSFKVLGEKKGWVKITANKKTGWVSGDYVNYTYKFSYGRAVASSSSSNAGSSSSSSSTTKPTTSKVTGKQVADYAVQFVGNPYVYGGTSLTNGTDCSGFTQSVYKHFGISLPRTSKAQSTYGKKVNASDIQVGDLVFYAKNGTVNHCALYIGNNKVVHASSPETGIKISTYNYRSVYAIRRVL